MGRYLARFRTLEHAERRILARAFIWLTLIDLALRLPVVSRRMRRTLLIAEPGVGSGDFGATERAQWYAHWIAVASRHHMVRARCLHRSSVLHLWLRAEGLPSRLQIGARKEGSELRAHAWVELAGQVVNDPAEAVDPFTPLAVVPTRELRERKAASHG